MGRGMSMRAGPDKTLGNDLAKWQRVRMAGVVLGVAALLLVAVGKWLADQPGREGATLVVLLGAALLLVASVAITLWSSRESRRLLARQVADLEREAHNVRRAASGSPLRVETASGIPEMDTRFTDPASRKAFSRRRWMLFALAFVLLALAEYQYSERGNLPLTAVYGAVGLGSLLYAVWLQQRLRMAR